MVEWSLRAVRHGRGLAELAACSRRRAVVPDQELAWLTAAPRARPRAGLRPAGRRSGCRGWGAPHAAGGADRA